MNQYCCLILPALPPKLLSQFWNPLRRAQGVTHISDKPLSGICKIWNQVKVRLVCPERVTDTHHTVSHQQADSPLYDAALEAVGLSSDPSQWQCHPKVCPDLQNISGPERTALHNAHAEKHKWRILTRFLHFSE